MKVIYNGSAIWVRPEARDLLRWAHIEVSEVDGRAVIFIDGKEQATPIRRWPFAALRNLARRVIR